MFGNEIEITSDVVEVFEEILERLENDSIENPGKPIVIELTRAENVVVDIYWEQFQEYTLEAFSDKWMPTRFIGDIIGKHYILFEPSNIPNVLARVSQIINDTLEVA